MKRRLTVAGCAVVIISGVVGYTALTVGLILAAMVLVSLLLRLLT